MGQTVRDANPDKAEYFCNHADRPWSTPMLLYGGYGCLFPGGKGAESWR